MTLVLPLLLAENEASSLISSIFPSLTLVAFRAYSFILLLLGQLLANHTAMVRALVFEEFTTVIIKYKKILARWKFRLSRSR